MKNSEYNKIISHFIDVLSQDKGIDLSTFYHNLETLEFEETKVKKSYDYWYNALENKVFFRDLKKPSIYHELLHCASSIVKDNIQYLGICQMEHSENESWHIQGLKWTPKKIVKGRALNEGYTEFLTCELFELESKSYLLERFYISKLIAVVEPQKMKQAYFSSNLNILISCINQYADMKEINNFIYGLDLCLHARSYTAYRDFELIQNHITYSSDFLVKCYTNYLIMEDKENKIDKLIDFINSFNIAISGLYTNKLDLKISDDTILMSVNKLGYNVTKDNSVNKINKKEK